MTRTIATLAALTSLYAATTLAADTTNVPTIVIRPNASATARMVGDLGRKAMDRYDDISGARARLKFAADAGDADAARRVAETYDPVWLVRAHVVGVEGLADPEQAFQWYKRAAEMGDRSVGNRYVESLPQ